MDIKNNKLKEIIEFARELFLQNLLLASKTKENLLKKGDLSGAEKIENEVIAVYEKMYQAVDIENIKKIENEEGFSLEKIEKSLDEVLKNTNFTKEFIEEQLMIRKKLAGKSGAEVIKKFHEYQIKEYKKILGDHIRDINKVLDQEERLNLELSNAIQEEEQFEIIDKLQPLREKSRNLTEKIEKYSKKIRESEAILSKKWAYEIYGTREEDELLKTFSKLYSQK